MGDPVKGGAQPIRLAERRVFSNSFPPLYAEGMGGSTGAGYLDGRGRVDAKGLSGLPRRFMRPNRCASPRG